MKAGDVMQTTGKSFILLLLANLKKNGIEETDRIFFINELLEYIGYNKEVQKEFLLHNDSLMSPIEIFRELETLTEESNKKIIIKINDEEIEEILSQYNEEKLKIVEKIAKDIIDKIKLYEASDNQVTWIMNNPNENSYIITRFVQEKDVIDCFVEEQLFTDGKVNDYGTEVVEVNKVGRVRVRNLRIKKASFVLIAQKSESKFLNLKLYSNKDFETNKKVFEDWQENYQDFLEIGEETPRVFQKKKVG